MNRQAKDRWSLSLVACLILMVSSPLIAQLPVAKASLDTSRILLGDQVNLWLELEHQPGMRMEFPVTGDSIAGKIEVLSASQPDTVKNGGNVWKIRQRLVLTSFDTGSYLIPPFVFRSPDHTDSLATRALPLKVLGIPIDTAKGITDIKLPYQMPITFWEILPYVLVGLILAFMLFLYIRYLRKKREKPIETPKPLLPLVPPHIWALAELDELIREKLWQQGKVKLYYSRLTDIVRRYIELRFKVPALEQTTEEIVRDFTENVIVKDDIIAELSKLLKLADLVKFAKWHPVTEEHEKSQQSAYDFVLRTKPVINLRKPAEENEPENKTEAGS